jgi:hypothetical protein
LALQPSHVLPPCLALSKLSRRLSLSHTHTHSQKQTNVKNGKAFLFFRTPSSYRTPDCRSSNVALKAPKKKRKTRITTIIDELGCLELPTSQQNAWPEDSTLDAETETQNRERERSYICRKWQRQWAAENSAQIPVGKIICNFVWV